MSADPAATEWMTLDDAYEHVARVLRSGPIADLKLREALVRGDIAARSGRLRREELTVFSDDTFAPGTCPGARPPPEGYEIPPEAWQHADVDWPANAFVRRGFCIEPDLNGALGRDFPEYVARRVRLLRQNVEALWPLPGKGSAAAVSVPTETPPARPHAGGASRRYDREAIKRVAREVFPQRRWGTQTAFIRAVELALQGQGIEPSGDTWMKKHIGPIFKELSRRS